MFLPLDIPFEIWIEHVAFELIYSMLVFYWDSLQGSSGLCNLLSLRYLPPACWSPFWDCGFIWPWACKFDEMDNKFFIVFDMSIYIYILMSQNIVIHFLPDFHIYNHDLFFCKLLCYHRLHSRSLHAFSHMIYLTLRQPSGPKPGTV